MTSFKLTCFHLSALALLTACAFFNVFHSSFKMDDHDVFKDPKIINMAYFKYNWVPEPNRYLKLAVASEETSYRPVTNSFLAVLYHWFGSHVQSYHAVSLILFGIGCGLLYGLVVLLTKDATWAFLSAALFLLHPINGLAVNYVVASAYALQLVIAMLCLFFFARSLESKRPALYILMSLVFFVGALGVHETSIVLPVYIFFMAWLVGRLGFWRSVARSIVFFLLLGGYVAFRLFYASLKSGVLEKYADFHMTVVGFFATYVKIISWYLSQLLVPDGVVLMWSSAILGQHVWMWLAWGIFLVLLCIALMVGFKRSVQTWALIVFVSGFVPVAGACLFRPTTGLVMEPHWMFLAAMGLFILYAWGLKRLILWNSRVGIFLSVCLLAGFMWLTQIYNDLWRDEKVYCTYWLEKVPSFKTTEFFLAYAYMNEKRYDLAREHLLNAREGIFGDWQIFGNLGVIDYEEGRYEEAIENYRKALTFNSDAGEIYSNIALVYERMGRLQEAVRNNQKALSLNRMMIEPRLNLARIALNNKDFETAVGLYRENLAIVPFERRSFQLLLTAFLGEGQADRAESLIQELTAQCKDAAALTEIGDFLAEKNMLVWALDLYMQAIRVDPRYKTVYVQAGILQANLNYPDRAIQLWEEALRLDPSDQRVGAFIARAKSLRSQ